MNIQIFVIVFAMMILDIVSGYLNAMFHNNVRSEKMREGIIHKFTFVIIVACAVLLELAQNTLDLTSIGITINIPIVSSVCIYIIGTEIISIMENLKKINPELANSKVYMLFGINDDSNKGDK